MPTPTVQFLGVLFVILREETIRVAWNILLAGSQYVLSKYTALKRRKLTVDKFLAPFFWPSSRPYLRYFGIWLCLLIDRVLLVLVPLQLGKVTDALTRSGTFI